MLCQTHTWVTLDDSIGAYDVCNETLVATIPVGSSPYFPQAIPDGSRILVPNLGSNTVSVVSASAAEALATIPVGVAPTSVAIDPASEKAYVTNSGSGTVSVICMQNQAVIATIPVGKGPFKAVFSHDGCRLYVSNSDSNTLSVIDPYRQSVICTISAGGRPNGLTTSSDDCLLFVVNNCGNSVSVIDTATFDTVAVIPVGVSPVEIAGNPEYPYLYVTNHGSNSVSVIHEQTFENIKDIPVGIHPLGLSVTACGQQIWVANQGDHSLAVISAVTNTVQSVIPTTYEPRGVSTENAHYQEENPDGFAPCSAYNDSDQLEDNMESVCIIVEKVYDSGYQRECFPAFTVDLPDNNRGGWHFLGVAFVNGLILPDSIAITPIATRPNFSRVQLTLQIPYTLTLRNGDNTVTLTGILPDVKKDVVLYFPPTRPEFDFNLRVETRSALLSSPLISDDAIELAIGSFVVVKVTGTVQLYIPAYGYCPEPEPLEEFPVSAYNPCENFYDSCLTPFPSDFFPPQLDEKDSCDCDCDCDCCD